MAIKQRIQTQFISLSLILLSACGSGPPSIDYGNVHCEQCRMTIMDNRFGCEIITVDDSTYFFDSIECMVSFEFAKKVSAAQIKTRWVSCFNQPGKLADVSTAVFVHSQTLASPKRANLSAFANAMDADSAIAQYGGVKLAYDKLDDRLIEIGFIR